MRRQKWWEIRGGNILRALGFCFVLFALLSFCASRAEADHYYQDPIEREREATRKVILGTLLLSAIVGLAIETAQKVADRQKQQGFAPDIRLPRSWEYRSLGSGYDLQRAARDR